MSTGADIYLGTTAPAEEAADAVRHLFPEFDLVPVDGGPWLASTAPDQEWVQGPVERNAYYGLRLWVEDEDRQTVVDGYPVQWSFGRAAVAGDLDPQVRALFVRLSEALDLPLALRFGDIVVAVRLTGHPIHWFPPGTLIDADARDEWGPFRLGPEDAVPLVR